MQLRELQGALPAVATALAPARCPLLRGVGDACGHAAFEGLVQELGAALEDDAQTARNSFINR